MVTLYKKNVWNDAKTVNAIATACFHKAAKVGWGEVPLDGCGSAQAKG